MLQKKVDPSYCKFAENIAHTNATKSRVNTPPSSLDILVDTKIRGSFLEYSLRNGPPSSLMSNKSSTDKASWCPIRT